MLILSLILAHLIADFYMQTDKMVKDKRKNMIKHILHHLLMTFAVLTAFYVADSFKDSIIEKLLKPLFFIVLTHYLIDLFKIMIVDSLKLKNEENLKRLFFFTIDQLLHLGMILLACQLFFEIDILRLGQQILSHHHGNISSFNALLFIMIIFILATSVSGHIIRILVGSLPNQLLTFEGKYGFKNQRIIKNDTNNNVGEKGLTEEYNYTIFSKHDLSRGKLIGYIERLLVILLTFNSAYPAIGFIVAAKSIARFKQMDDRDWAEYFLLGTLTSMFIGISLGILLKEVLT
ncbi:MAG: DUF3307 domain-containing protein [Bacillota bacterium]|nr:DUF3307 domain-containing protein [Bacillota bacterium]